MNPNNHKNKNKNKNKNKSKNKKYIPVHLLKQKIQKLDLTKTPVVLDSCTTILNSKKFVESHFKIIEANSGNPRFLPYYLRLLKFYETQYNPTKPT